MYPHSVMFIILLLLIEVNSITLQWSKDTGNTALFHNDNDDSLTAIYNIMDGTYTDIEPYHRRLSELTQTELRTLILDKHNELRAKTANGTAPCRCGSSCGTGHHGTGYHPGATNMNALFWDSALERVAQQYSDRCIFLHNDESTSQTLQFRYLASWTQTKEKYIGENLYVSSTGHKVWNNIYGDTDYGIEGGLHSWWNECIDLQLSEGGSCADDIEHYTQYIRADSRFVGCGVSICPYGVQTRSETASWASLNLVCNYAGGQYGDIPYDIAESEDEVASKCEPDRIAHFGLYGLCGGPQARDYFEDPQESYEKTSFPSSVWICDDGTGRDICSEATSDTPKLTLAPTISTTTAKPTNKPITPQPTSNPLLPTLYPSDNPTQSITPQPTQNIVTPHPTTPTTSPTTNPPTKKRSRPPTSPPPTTNEPTKSPVYASDVCDVSDCTFSTNVEWKSERKRYRGFTDAVWKTERTLLDLETEEQWGGTWSYSWGAQYRRSEDINDWILYVWDQIDIEWNEMECTKRDYYDEYMHSDDFEEQMRSGILDIMGNGRGEVTDVTVHILCTTSINEAFGIFEEDGYVDIPFSKWNLNTYDFSDWFVLVFLLFAGCFMCFVCGYMMHRKRVLRALEDATYSDYEEQEEMDELDEGPDTQNQNRWDSNNTRERKDSIDDIQIGVSLESKHRILSTEDWDWR